MRNRKSILCVILLIILLIALSNIAGSYAGSGTPVKYISSCEMDLNGDGQTDIALLLESSNGRELIVLLRTVKGYDSFIISKGKSDMFLSCHFGKSVKESETINSSKTYATLGTYLRLHQPEGASVVYFWDGSSFKEVWTSD